VNSLKLDFVQEHGYAKPRCLHTPGCPDEIQVDRILFDETRPAENAMIDAWALIFNDNSTVPDVLGTRFGSSQFIVSSNQVKIRPRKQYVRFRQ
jgi:hypothetical protein